jgi:purine-cytosine permease-like protein
MLRNVFRVKEMGTGRIGVELSRGWRYSVVLIMLAGFGVLIGIAVHTYTGNVGPPIGPNVAVRQ